MKLADMTWQEVDACSRAVVVLIPTGSLEEHGPHLPLFTDSILAGYVAGRVENAAKEKVLLVPTLWLGASLQHLAYSGTLSASFATYLGAVSDVIESLQPHGFRKFYVLNGHGGNTEPNGIALRDAKNRFKGCTFGHRDYYAFAQGTVAQVLTGPQKFVHHASEAETSMMMHVRPDLVRIEAIRDDGLAPDPPVVGVIHHFDEISQQGSHGYATFATAEKGSKILDSAIAGALKEIMAIAEGYVLKGLPEANAEGDGGKQK